MGKRNEISILCCCNRPQEYVYQGSPYNTYKNSKNIDNELGFPTLLSTKTLKT